MPKGILTVSQSAVNVIEICTNSIILDDVDTNDWLENSIILLLYIIAQKRGRRVRYKTKCKKKLRF